MNKRILSILLGLMLVVSLLVMAVPASAAPADPTLTITADKTEAKPGDTITYTVTLGPVDKLGYIQAEFDIPAGLTFVDDSGDCSAAQEAMGYTSLDIGNMHVLSGAAAKQNYSSETDTVIGTFQCTVDDDATGTLTVGFVEDYFEAGILKDWDTELTINPVVNSAVTIVSGSDETTAPETAAPETAAPETAAPETAAPETAAPETSAPETAAPETQAHQHTLEFVERVEPTPEKDGVEKHYVCTECGKLFADSTGAVEVTEESLRIPYVAPETQAPETQAPETQAPETAAPETAAPETAAPETAAPETAAPETAAPETAAPETAAPETAAPETAAPETEAPVETEAPAETTAPDETTAPVETKAATVDEKPTTAPSATTAATKDAATATSATSTSATAKTGDSTHMYLWMIIMLASLAGACAVLYTAKRKGIFTK